MMEKLNSLGIRYDLNKIGKYIRTIILLTVMFMGIPVLGQDNSWQQISPSGLNTLYVCLNDGKLSYSVTRKDELLLSPSSLGLLLQKEEVTPSLQFLKLEQSSHDEVWSPVWGKNTFCRNSFNEMKLYFRQKESSKRLLNVIFRIYDDGIAFRYEICSYDNDNCICIKEDNTSFMFPKDDIWWSHNGERTNLGPNQISNFPDKLQTPLLIRYSNSHFITIHEAGIDSLSNFILEKKGSLGMKCLMQDSEALLPCLTSWRAIFIAENEKELLSSDFLVNLNSECAIKDVSWIEPGKSTWNWRARGYVAEDGFKYDTDTETQKRLIDFAAENNIKYHTIDADWYGPEFEKNSDPTQPDGNIDIRYIMSYAKKKNVGIFLYLNDVAAKRYGLDSIFTTFKRLGAVGVKYGFMTGNGQEKVLQTRKVIRMCAQYRLMVIFHDNPIPPSGDHRTWPHVIAREFGLAQGDNKIAAYPRTIVNQAFIQSLCGPLDMSNGWFDLNNAGKRSRVFDMVPSTIVAELAKTIVIFTGFNCLPDAPEAYKKKPDLLAFIRLIPDVFDSYQILSGQIDSHISVARKKENEWFVASLTIEESRTLNVSLDFLDDNRIYQACFYEDALDAHYLHNKEAYIVYEKVVRKGDNINIKMAAGGGSCVYIKPVK